jgi:hypothetical protein
LDALVKLTPYTSIAEATGEEEEEEEEEVHDEVCS